MSYQLVMFDFDGTLADSLPWLMSVANNVATRYKFKRIEADELAILRGYGARQVVKHLGVPLWKIPFIARHTRGLMAQSLDQIQLFAGVGPMLHQLAAANITLALVTSNSYANARRLLGSENAALFTHYECGASVFGKRARFRKVLRRSGTPAHRAICIGDEIRDLEAARQLGIPFGAVSWGFTDPEAFAAHQPAHIFSGIDDIAAQLVPSAGPAEPPRL